MKFMRIKALVAYAVLLSLAVLLLGCKPIFEKKPIPGKESKEETAAPAAAPAPAPAPAVAEPPKTEEIQSIQSLPATTEAPDATMAATEGAFVEEIASNVSSAPAADDGDDVVKITPTIMKKVQQALVNYGFNPGPVDGVSGAKTVAAIESFQKQNDIPVGKLTKRTLRALGVDF